MTKRAHSNLHVIFGLIAFFGFYLANLAAQRLTPWASHDIYGNSIDVPLNAWSALFYAACISVARWLLGLSRTSTGQRQRTIAIVVRAGIATAIGTVLSSALLGVILFSLVGRYIIMLAALLSFATMVAVDLLLETLLRKEARRILVISTKAGLVEVARLTRQTSLSSIGEFHLHGYDADDAGADEKIRIAIKTGAWTDLVLDRDPAVRGMCSEFLLPLVNSGVRVLGLETLIELYLQKVDLRVVDESWFLTFESYLSGRFALQLKRLSDVVASGLLLILTAPLFPVIMCVIKLQDGGPIIYRQHRKGVNGRLFQILKFRTMGVNAEANGAVWAAQRDHRVTLAGRVLRKTRLDEIPQLINILRGEMSFVGPRPERPELVARLVEDIPTFELRELVKPGLTGWAQINYPYGASVADAKEKLAYDLFYIKNASVQFDMFIMLKTIFVVARGSR